MTAFGLLVDLEARSGKEEEVAKFLADAKALVDAEPGTTAWFAFRSGLSSFRIFDVFETDDDRQAHLRGRVAEGLMAHADELFAVPPVITPVDVLARKLPGQVTGSGAA